MSDRRAVPEGGRWLAVAFASAVAIALAPAIGADVPGFVVVWPIVATYGCGAYAAPRPGLAASVALAVAMQLQMGFAEAPNLEIAIATIPPWWVGHEVRRRRALVAELAQRTRELEAEEEAFIRLSVQRERARIARDLHDIVSHHLAVMVIQAGAGRLAEPWRPEVAQARFTDIREAALQAVAEADRLVTMLHPDGDAAPRLASLLDRAEAAGARVVVTPADVALGAEVEAIAYRIVQEALTNAMKHAPGAPLEIEVAVAGGELGITVGNDLGDATSPIASTGSGLGLAGMRERVAGLGGSMTAGPDGHGGFRLCARLPLAPAASLLPLP
jgi:signal transduction histidine kinase